MIEKLNKLENLTTQLMKGEENYSHDIIDFLKNNNFEQKQLLEYIYILLNSLGEEDKEMQGYILQDGFDFWRDDEMDKSISITLNENETLETILKTINDFMFFKVESIIVYSYDNGYCDKKYDFERLKEVVGFLVENNEILSIYIDTDSIALEVTNDNFLSLE